jgi:YidC/Oxa1 family membrane protein insertase
MHSIVHAIGSVFQPIFSLFGWLMAFFYRIVPNYGLAITLLTIVIMGALTPFTVKSTKSMQAMARLQPEIKKLQIKYKGAENRAQLNEEMMRLYREEGANPVGGCLPLLLQAPFLFILYSVIKGLSNQVLVHGALISQPRYIPSTSKMYHDLVLSHGKIDVFGMDMSLKLFSHHATTAAAIPFYGIVLFAVGLQYFQMAQLNRRSMKAGQEMSSQQKMTQRFMPILFAYFYMVIPAAVVLYMVISSVIRIITQDVMFRSGVITTGKPVEREIPAINPDNTPTSKPAAQPRSKNKRKRKDR